MISDEEQKEIEAEFLLSWDRMEAFFGDSDSPWISQIYDLIRVLRARGYDRHLRAGQSMISLIVSRSREHGLRDGQPRLVFEIIRNRELRVSLIGDHVNVTVTSARIEVTHEIDGLLQPLLAYPID